MNRLISFCALFVLVFSFGINTLHAQVYNQVRTGNQNVLNTKDSRLGLVGEPYLYKDFAKAMVKFGNGTAPDHFEVKYDQLEDVLVIKGKTADEVVTFSEPVTEFKFNHTEKLFRNGFNPIDKATNKSYFEMIYDGKTKYLRRNAKIVIEAKEYNVATVTRKIESDVNLYLSTDGKNLSSVKANEKSMLKVLGKEAELTKYIKENRINFKNDEDVKKLLTYYDSIK